LLRCYGMVLRLFAGLYVLASMAMNRSQEREADRLMVRFAGRADAAAALIEADILSGWWSGYTERIIGLGWGMDLAPTPREVVAGFDRLLAAHGDARAKARLEPPRAERSPLDTHPPTAERIASIESQPEPSVRAAVDTRPATALLPTFATAAPAAIEESFPYGYRERLDWDEFAHRVYLIDDSRAAYPIYRAASRLTAGHNVTLADVLALCEAGELPRLMAALRPDDPGAGEQEPTDVLAILVRDALTRTGAVRWHMTWTGSARACAADGTVVDPDGIAGPRPTEPGEVLAGIGQMRSGASAYDVLLLPDGLVLAENPGAHQPGGWTDIHQLARFGSARLIAERHRFISVTSIAEARVSGQLTTKVALRLTDGTKIALRSRLSSPQLNEGSDRVFKEQLTRVG
ncbi:M48 family metalloprotease, partial [Mycolicibacterium sp.]|uniref:M48 family metalloprotease n=1 Tax=Mycolicibacterium sp. TaxID=2320850 RepID=UPI003D09F8B7